jgi:hypothetical protein
MYLTKNSKKIRKESKTVSDELKRMITETVENLKHLDEESLRIMKSNSEILKARDALDKKENK